MRVFSLTTGADTAGIGYRLARAFDLHAPTGWTLRSMVASRNYIAYPADLPYSRRELVRQYDAADVVMLHNTLHGHDFYDLTGKPTVLMHHGMSTAPQQAPEAEAIGAAQMASTIDLTLVAPWISWLPAPYEVAEMRAMRRPGAGETVRIVHAPTNRAVKGTADLLEAVDRLRDEGWPVELDLVEGVTWAESLRRIAGADIAYDQPTLGYGCFAVECWAMGLPVVAGVARPEVRSAMLAEWGGLPFLDQGSAGGVYPALLELVRDPAARREWAGRGSGHARRHHDGARVVERLIPILASAGPTTPAMGSRRRGRVA